MKDYRKNRRIKQNLFDIKVNLKKLIEFINSN
jgi:hypothetical protein